MPADSAMTERAWELLDDYPSWAREAPEFKALALCAANEGDRMIAKAAEVRDNFIPARLTELGLPWWEAFFGITPPFAATLEDRRAAVLARIARSLPDPSGATWESYVTDLIGGGWTYVEDSAAGELTITVPFAPGSAVFTGLEDRIRPFTPAHLNLVVNSAGGFILDESELDEEAFGA